MEQKENQAKQNMRQSIEYYQKMIEEVEDYAIILLDRDGNIMNWNRGAEKIKGYTGDEIIGKNFRNFYFTEDLERKLPETLINLAATDGKASHEGWRRRKDNSRFWGSVVITAVHDDKHNIIGFTKVTRDLTERKISEEQIKQYTAELESKNRELSQFVSIASHDLQEPLRKIGIFAGLLNDNLDDKELAKVYLDKISTSAQRMSNLIKEVLKYSMLSTEEMAVATDLNQVLKSIVEDFEVTIKEKNAVINYPDMPVVNGIPIQLHQLFLNVIGNALKFTPADAVINITWEQIKTRKPETIQFRVNDNGVGFGKEYTEKIFKMFQRLDPAHQGNGIGLALCKKIIENHHGSISAESEPGKGTTITFELPV